MYISFAKGAQKAKLQKVARTLLNLPLLTAGYAERLATQGLHSLTALFSGDQGWKQHKEASKAEQPRSVVELLAEEKAEHAADKEKSSTNTRKVWK